MDKDNIGETVISLTRGSRRVYEAGDGYIYGHVSKLTMASV